MTPRLHPRPPKNDFHLAFLWIRAIEIESTGAPPAAWLAFHVEMNHLFECYRSPWRA